MAVTRLAGLGGPNIIIDEDRQREILSAAVEKIGVKRGKVLLLPPDRTRGQSGAGPLTRMACELLPGCEIDIMPALGTHVAMSADQLTAMFGRIPRGRFVEHRWRSDLKRLGEVPGEFVKEVSGGVVDYPIPIEINRRLTEGGYDLILSIGQVVPHEVVGMANGSKNIFVGAGGQETINRSHFLGAAYGMERMMGRIDTPVRKVFDYADDRYLSGLPIRYVLTVVGRDGEGRLVMRGLFVGDGQKTFREAAALSQQVNLNYLDEPLKKVVVYLDPHEFSSTWLGNKSIYRTRMAIADRGELIVIAPAVKEFGEDPEIDRLIRKYGYRGTQATLAAVSANQDLRGNLSAAAHLIHGSSEGRFTIIYATDPAKLSRAEVESVGFQWMPLADALKLYDPSKLKDGPQGDFFYVSNPALGLWALRSRFA